MAPDRGRQRVQQAADALAKEVLAHISITEEDVTRVLKQLFVAKWSQDRFAANPPGKKHINGGSLGLVSPIGKKGVALKAQQFDCMQVPHVARLLNRYRDEKLGIRDDRDDEVRPTTMQINFNFAGDVHIDGNNQGVSHIHAFGSFVNGALLLECNDGDIHRELVYPAGKVSAAAMRTRGIYRFKRVDIGRGIETFNGADQLHCAETCSGGRYSVVWFSLMAAKLIEMRPKVYQALREMGFRSRSSEEAALLAQAPQSTIKLKNDRCLYDDGFLFFSRQKRVDLERSGVPSVEASHLLKKQWQALSTVMRGTSENDRSYWAGLERLQEVLNRRRKQNNMSDDRLSSTKDDRSSFMHQRREDGGVEKARIMKEQTEAFVVEDDAHDVDEPRTNKELVEVFAEHILAEFPTALNETDEGFALLTRVLTEFGFGESHEERSYAYHFVQARRQLERDEFFAKHVQRCQSGKFDDNQIQITIEDSQPPPSSPAAACDEIQTITIEDSQQTPASPSPIKKARFGDMISESDIFVVEEVAEFPHSRNSCTDDAHRGDMIEICEDPAPEKAKCHQGDTLSTSLHDLSSSGVCRNNGDVAATRLSPPSKEIKPIRAMDSDKALELLLQLLDKKGALAARTMQDHISNNRVLVVRHTSISCDMLEKALQQWGG